MKQIKTIAIRFNFTGFGGEKDSTRFDDAVNETIKKLEGDVVDIKYAYWQGFAPAMIIYEKR